MRPKQAHRHGRCLDNSYLVSGLGYLNDLQQEVEGTIELIEKLIQRTRWLSEEDRIAVFEWIDAHEKAAYDYHVYMKKRTRQVKKYIMRSIDTTNQVAL